MNDPLRRTVLVAVVLLATAMSARPLRATHDDGEGHDHHHAEVFAENDYPSAALCAPCHEQIYREWSSSNHAYAAISPVFHRFEQTINDLASGTIGSFCVRCHIGAGTTLGEARELPLWERSRVAREGVTCISCHRVKEAYGKANGARRIEAGDIHQPIYGTRPGEGVAEVVDKKDYYKVATGPGERGPKIHNQGIRFEQLSESQFCVSCHQVAVHPGIKLEVVWDQYRASPAAGHGITCQDCHMGKTPGRAEGYATGPVAVVAGKAIHPEGRHASHAFAGPGYPIAHPGIFPHSELNARFDIQQWLRFDYRSGWGDPDWEDALEESGQEGAFPGDWGDRYDREEALEIIQANLERLEEKRVLRRQVMENGSRIDGPFFRDEPRAGKGLSLAYKITNTDEGHNLPSGSLGAQPELWFNVALVDPDGTTVWESGYVDTDGDMADLHSKDVLEGRLPHDGQLFNLQTKFLTTNIKGTDREMYLPVNFDIDQLPFIRPAGTPNSVMNHPPFIRMEGRSIPPLGYRWARYRVPARILDRPGTWRLASRMRSRAEPIYFMRFIGATTDMIKAMNEWMLDIHPYTVEFEVR